MERPDLDQAEDLVRVLGSFGPSHPQSLVLQDLIDYIRHLESQMAGEDKPYVIEAREFDPETMERYEIFGESGIWVRSLVRSFNRVPGNRLIIVRNSPKYKPEPKFEFFALHKDVFRTLPSCDRLVAEFETEADAAEYAAWKNKEQGES